MAKKYLTEKQRRTRVLVIGLVIAIVLSVVAMGAAMIYSNHVNNGGNVRSKISFKSENYKVDNCQMTYYYYSNFYSIYGQYSQYLQFDPTAPLSAQTFSLANDGSTWQSYLVNQTANMVQQYLVYAEDAKANGFVLETLQADVDAAIDSYRETAKGAGLTFEAYVEKMFGVAVKEADMRKAIELQLYSEAYYDKFSGELKASITDAEYDEYAQKNTLSLQQVDLRSYAFKADTSSEDTSVNDAMKAQAKADADAFLALATSSQGFIDAAKADITEKNATSTTKLTEEDIAKQADNVTPYKYAAGEALSDWAFAADRKVGDATVIDDGAGTYTVYYLEAVAYRDGGATKNVRHILFNFENYESSDAAKAKADEVYAKFLETGKTEADFEALAKEYNEDSNSLYENVPKGKMVAPFENWIFDEARVAGDTGIVETEYGYHIMYFVGEGLTAWKVDVEKTLLDEKITSFTEELANKYKDSIKVDNEKIVALPDYIPQTAFDTSDVQTTAPETTAPQTTAPETTAPETTGADTTAAE